ncbi:MAG: polysaccharide deacetylase [Firmicutes bacterium]|nr:polysaccharide deacetylase [Bacillota bacterium]
MVKKYFYIVFLSLVLSTFQINAFANRDAEQGRSYFPPILMYHDIKVTPINGFDVAVKDFIKQLDWLAAEGYYSLSMEEFLDCVNTNRPIPEKAVLITFDDGYEGIYKYAAPELTKRKMHATFFIFKDGINLNLPGYPYITDKQLKELAANPLFAIQSHTMTHPDLSNSPKIKIQQEVSTSKNFIEAYTQKPCRIIAYPYGHYNQDVLQAVKEAEYEAAFAVADLGLMGYEAKYTIPRIYMGTIMSENNMALFKKYIIEYKNMPADAFKERFGELPR